MNRKWTIWGGISAPLWLLLGVFLLMPGTALAQEEHFSIEATGHPLGILSVAIFIAAYFLVAVEEFTHLRKSKPVILAASLIWGILAIVASGDPAIPAGFAEKAFRSTFLEFAELFFFLLVAMAYINAMTERNVFEALRSFLSSRGFSYRAVFWITGTLAFFISPMADNMTTALLMGAVVLAVGADNKKFVALSCINIVVAANAGGAYSPFGDITTLMVWQAGDIDFFQFFWLFLPALVNVLVPALLMHFALPKGVPQARGDMVAMRPGARRIIGLFLFTIALTVAGHQALGMPPVLGMLTGFALLAVFGFHLRRRGQLFDAYSMVAGAEWDTLFFFYGVLLCVGGLAAFGYLSLLSTSLYGDLGATAANVLIGLVSAVIDNIPVMYAVLTMNPPMDVGQWMLVTLTAGVGGSLLSIGSAAGVALMGQARGSYTFFSHLKWSGAVALGYAASIATHLLVNGHLFGVPV